jgi:hypothetical protein
MATPINPSAPQLGNQQNVRADGNSAAGRSRGDAPGVADGRNDETPAATTQGDRLSLSQAARELQAAEEHHGAIDSREQAEQVLAQLRQQIHADYGLALKAHAGNASQGLAQLLTQPPS